jgi:hypothetical protein
MPRKGIAQRASVLAEQVGPAVAVLVQQPRRALDVREEERDGAGRQLSAHVRIMA